tara:strand:- start:269 stop:418 length:150 start_codon:yes stop_codon:yes gene_type:complete
MDRLNEMHLEDPSSEHDLYNMGRRGPMEADVSILMIIILAVSGPIDRRA